MEQTYRLKRHFPPIFRDLITTVLHFLVHDIFMVFLHHNLKKKKEMQNLHWAETENSYVPKELSNPKFNLWHQMFRIIQSCWHVPTLQFMYHCFYMFNTSSLTSSCLSASLGSSTSTLFNKGITRNRFTALSNSKSSQAYFNLKHTGKKPKYYSLSFLTNHTRSYTWG